MNKLTRQMTKIMLIWMVIFLLAGMMEPAWAHGNERTLQRTVTVGTYRASIWTSPPILRTGEVHVEAILHDQQGKLAQTGLVHITLTGVDRQLPVRSALANPVGGIKGIWAAAFHLPEPGDYRVEVAIIDGANGGTVDFEIEIIRVARLIRVLLFMQLMVSGVAALWLLQKGLTIWFGTMRRVYPSHSNDYPGE